MVLIGRVPCRCWATVYEVTTVVPHEPSNDAGVRRTRVRIPPSTHIMRTIDRRGCNLGDRCFGAGLVGQAQADAGVDLGLVQRICVLKQGVKFAERWR